jgi:hypothetical protein
MSKLLLFYSHRQLPGFYLFIGMLVKLVFSIHPNEIHPSTVSQIKVVCGFSLGGH